MAFIYVEECPLLSVCKLDLQLCPHLYTKFGGIVRREEKKKLYTKRENEYRDEIEKKKNQL